MDRREILRAMVKGVYDLQDLRVKTGQRLAANFRSKLGFDAGQKSDEEEEANNILIELRKSYRRITDGIVAEGKERLAGMPPKARKAAKAAAVAAVDADEESILLPGSVLLTPKNFQGDEIISEYAELVLVEQYLSLLREETKQMRGLLIGLKPFPIWTNYLTNIRGIGPAMAGCLISELDPYKAKYPSSFHKYAGYDVVHIPFCKTCDEELVPKLAGPLNEVYLCENKECAKHGSMFTLLDEENINWVGEGRARRALHLRNYTYTDREGVEKTKKGLSYNPWLKMKLFILGQCLIRAGNENYKKVYSDYRVRLDNRSDLLEESKKHKQLMAQRYMVKIFLVDLHIKWRTMEGLPVSVDYAAAKLETNHGVDPGVVLGGQRARGGFLNVVSKT